MKKTHQFILFTFVLLLFITSLCPDGAGVYPAGGAGQVRRPRLVSSEGSAGLRAEPY